MRKTTNVSHRRHVCNCGRPVTSYMNVCNPQIIVTHVPIQFKSDRVDAVGLGNWLRVVQAGNRGSNPGAGNTFRLTCGLVSQGIMV